MPRRKRAYILIAETKIEDESERTSREVGGYLSYRCRREGKHRDDDTEAKRRVHAEHDNDDARSRV
ncbi:uncharacterized protein G2W53_015502 [Senna tora]|uniref:Uncharacterized protein n=1 Tax=Senna tora TaxID=362788 RepID=A0A834WVF1_9FABA|nr:uncharacterized protein G2W53_015502 [Senna tora]